MWNYNFYVYITTNPDKTALYTGVTNNIERRLFEHYENRGKWKSFAGRYFCYNLIWLEHFSNINEAIAREKEIKGWSREKKELLIARANPDWNTIIFKGEVFAKYHPEGCPLQLRELVQFKLKILFQLAKLLHSVQDDRCESAREKVLQLKQMSSGKRLFAAEATSSTQT